MASNVVEEITEEYIKSQPEYDWESYKEKHDKHYEAEEDNKRYKIFIEKVKTVIQQNRDYEAGRTTWTAGLNQFTDMEADEVSKGFLGCKKKEK